HDGLSVLLLLPIRREHPQLRAIHAVPLADHEGHDSDLPRRSLTACPSYCPTPVRSPRPSPPATSKSKLTSTLRRFSAARSTTGRATTRASSSADSPMSPRRSSAAGEASRTR